MTSVGPEQANVEFTHQLFRCGSQRTASLEEEFPKVLRAGANRARSESVSDRAQKSLEVGAEFFPVGQDQPSPMQLGRRAFCIETRFHSLGVDYAVRLSEVGQAADAGPALQANESTHPNAKSIHQVADPSTVVTQGLQAIGLATTNTVFRLLNLLGAVVLQILNWGECSRVDDLHKLHIPEALAPPQLLFSPGRPRPLTPSHARTGFFLPFHRSR